MKKLKSFAIADFVLKIVIPVVLLLAAFFSILIGSLAVGLGAAFGAVAGAMVGGEEGAQQAASQVDMPVGFLIFSRITLIIAVVMLTASLGLAIASLIMVKKAENKKQLKVLAIFDIIFLNLFVGIGMLTAKETAFVKPDQVTQPKVDVVDCNIEE